jgi:hypothetical protein
MPRNRSARAFASTLRRGAGRKGVGKVPIKLPAVGAEGAAPVGWRQLVRTVCFRLRVASEESRNQRVLRDSEEVDRYASTLNICLTCDDLAELRGRLARPGVRSHRPQQGADPADAVIAVAAVAAVIARLDRRDRRDLQHRYRRGGPCSATPTRHLMRTEFELYVVCV